MRRKPQTFDGALLDVAAASAFLGCSQQFIRKRAKKKLLPARRLFNRIVFRRVDLEALVNNLPGVTLDDARKNLDQWQKGNA